MTVETNEEQQAIKTLKFTVDLKSLTKISRRYTLEKNWRAAIRMLQAATIPPMPLDDVVAVLSGKMMTVGNEKGGTLVPQDTSDEEYLFFKGTSEWQNAGLLERDGEYYQPYAIIQGFTWDDESEVLERLESLDDWTSMAGFARLMCTRYMDEVYSDIVELDIHEKPVLFKKVQGPAFWIDTFTDAKAAFKDFFAKRASSLKEVGSDRLTNANRNPQCADFYLKGIVKGFITEHGYATVQLPEPEMTLVAEFLELRDGYDEAVSELGESSQEFDDDGYLIDASHLFGKLQDNATYALYRHRIREQAEKVGGFMQLLISNPKDDVKEYVEVPTAPFLLWARYHAFREDKNTFPNWKPVVPSGTKMMSDNPIHSDWFLYTGLSPKEAYDHDHPVNKAAWRYASALARTKGSNCIVLAGKGVITGPAVFPKKNEGVPAGSIAVVSHAGVDYDMAMRTACKDGTGAVIAAVGGKLAHLAIVSRELDGRLVVADNVMEAIKEGDIVTVNLDTKNIFVHGKPEALASSNEWELD